MSTLRVFFVHNVSHRRRRAAVIGAWVCSAYSSQLVAGVSDAEYGSMAANSLSSDRMALWRSHRSCRFIQKSSETRKSFASRLA